MPKVQLLCYQEKDGFVPVLDWLNSLPKKAAIKCRYRIKRLNDSGHNLRRPEADYLRDGIYELRASFQGVQYRILYFFQGQQAIILSQGLQKEDKVPPIEIERAIQRKRKFEENPEIHSYKGTLL